MTTRCLSGLLFRVHSPSEYILAGDWIVGERQGLASICFAKGAWHLCLWAENKVVWIKSFQDKSSAAAFLRGKL